MEIIVCAGVIGVVGVNALMASTIGEGIEGGARHPTGFAAEEVSSPCRSRTAFCQTFLRNPPL
jgi:hypothetical protein